MTLLPIVGREMRAASRQLFTYHLRALGAALAMGALVLFMADHPSSSGMGGELFRWLHVLLFCGVWLLVPFLTADTISRERREGTLSLLFLTPLRAGEIVFAKGVAEGLRALTLWLAVVPVVGIPLLLGGVGAGEALVSVMVMLSSICWALSAGLMASAWNRVWLRSMAASVVLASAFVVVQAFVVGLLVITAFPLNVANNELPPLLLMLGVGFAALLNVDGAWVSIGRLVAAGPTLQILASFTLLSFLILAVAVILAGKKTHRSWQDPERSRRRMWVERVFCTPVLWLGFLRRWLRRSLERNPVGWLEQRRWTGRLVTWAWLAVVISFTTAIVAENMFYRSYAAMLGALAFMLATTVGMTAAGSFRRERDNGVLELLLVSPLGERALAWGRLRGIWTQFLPASGLLFGVWIYFESFLGATGSPEPRLRIVSSILTLLSTSVAGLYFSIRCRNFIPAVVVTLLVGFLVPAALARLLSMGLFLLLGWPSAILNYRDQNVILAASLLFQAVLPVLFWRALVTRLRLRRFPLYRPALL